MSINFFKKFVLGTLLYNSWQELCCSTSVTGLLGTLLYNSWQGLRCSTSVTGLHVTIPISTPRITLSFLHDSLLALGNSHCGMYSSTYFHAKVLISLIILIQEYATLCWVWSVGCMKSQNTLFFSINHISCSLLWNFLSKLS